MFSVICSFPTSAVKDDEFREQDAMQASIRTARLHLAHYAHHKNELGSAARL